ncbi:hypothetical protein [Microcoleus sp. B4-D4]|uniref:hypothetical protein n=1 Tax=Microcoleus sp. B4-D4 TaxID=2818667 RepID=UPI002FD3B136
MASLDFIAEGRSHWSLVISYWSLVIRKKKAEKRRSEEGFSDRREGLLVAIDG